MGYTVSVRYMVGDGMERNGWDVLCRDERNRGAERQKTEFEVRNLDKKEMRKGRYGKRQKEKYNI